MKVKINKDLIEAVAKNARLDLTDSEKEQFEKELKEVLEAFSKLDEVNTDGIQPSMQPVPMKNRTREDEPVPCVTQEEALSLTEHKKDGYFKGPKVI